MIRFLIYFLIIAALAGAAAWFAEQPGELTIDWLGYEIRTTFMFALVAVLAAVVALIAGWALLRGLIGAPGAVFDFFRLRRQRRGYAALSKGMIAIGSGDSRNAARYAGEAARLIGSEPLAQLLKAQTAQMSGDRKAARRVFQSMLQSPETEVLGLRGLFLQARRDGDAELARNYAERAIAINPGLAWASEAMLAQQSADGDWEAAEHTLETARRFKLIDRAEGRAKHAVLLTARALEAEDADAATARELALEAHRLKPDLVPAAVVAGRLLAGEGEMRKAAKVLEKTWKLAPHPDIAEVYAHLRHGDSPRDRLKRVMALAGKGSPGTEGAIAVATAAAEAHAWEEARKALDALVAERPSVRVCMLMAEIEEGEHGDRGRAREWLARALRAPRDPVWTADGHVSQEWAPVSPVSGELGAFEWKVPVEGIAYDGGRAAAGDAGEAEAEEGPPELVIEAKADRQGEAGDKGGDAAPAEAEPEAAKKKGGKAEKEPPGDGGGAEAGKEKRPEPAEGEKGKTAEKSEESDVFVAPRAPDDPGVERAEPAARRWLSGLLAR